jgi:glycosyltransferase involved in cell wall biosynthesis
MSGPTVSVVIPAYKAAGTIARALDSVLAQARPPDEIVVVDDGSPDDTAAVVAASAGRVKYVRKANGGAASARNRGLDESSGELIALLDADDYWHPSKLEKQLDVFARHPEVGLVSARWHVQEPGHEPGPCDDKPRRYYDRVLRPRGAAVVDVARLVWTSVLLFRRDLLGADRFDTTLKTAQDVDMWVRLVEKAPVYLLREPLATYWLTPGSLSRSDFVADYRVVASASPPASPTSRSAWRWAARRSCSSSWPATATATPSTSRWCWAGAACWPTRSRRRACR